MYGARAVISGKNCGDGGIIMAGWIGLSTHGGIARPHTGLVLMFRGIDFLSPTVHASVGLFYEERSSRRDSVHVLLCVGFLFGAFFGPLVIGHL